MGASRSGSVRRTLAAVAHRTPAPAHKRPYRLRAMSLEDESKLLCAVGKHGVEGSRRALFDHMCRPLIPRTHG